MRTEITWPFAGIWDWYRVKLGGYYLQVGNTTYDIPYCYYIHIINPNLHPYICTYIHIHTYHTLHPFTLSLSPSPSSPRPNTFHTFKQTFFGSELHPTLQRIVIQLILPLHPLILLLHTYIMSLPPSDHAWPKFSRQTRSSSVELDD